MFGAYAYRRRSVFRKMMAGKFHGFQGFPLDGRGKAEEERRSGKNGMGWLRKASGLVVSFCIMMQCRACQCCASVAVSPSSASLANRELSVGAQSSPSIERNRAWRRGAFSPILFHKLAISARENLSCRWSPGRQVKLASGWLSSSSPLSRVHIHVCGKSISRSIIFFTKTIRIFQDYKVTELSVPKIN